MDTSTLTPGSRVGLITPVGVEHVTVAAVDHERQTIDFRADDGFEHWAKFSQIF